MSSAQDIVLALQSKGMLNVPVEKALPIAEQAVAWNWSSLLMYGVQIVGFVILVVVCSGWIKKLISSVWFLLSSIPEIVYQIFAVTLSFAGVYAIAMYPPQNHMLSQGLEVVAGVLSVGSVVWMLKHVRYMMMRLFMKCPYPQSFNIIAYVMAILFGFATFQDNAWWMLPMPIVLMSLFAFRHQRIVVRQNDTEWMVSPMSKMMKSSMLDDHTYTVHIATLVGLVSTYMLIPAEYSWILSVSVAMMVGSMAVWLRVKHADVLVIMSAISVVMETSMYPIVLALMTYMLIHVGQWIVRFMSNMSLMRWTMVGICLVVLGTYFSDAAHLDMMATLFHRVKDMTNITYDHNLRGAVTLLFSY